MSTTIFGKKLGMSQYFIEDGKCVPVTIIEAGPCVVIQKKTTAKDGYEAIQLGFGKQKEHRINKPLQGHYRVAGDQFFRHLAEVRVDNAEIFEIGQVINTDIFQIGEFVHVTGKSKGRGFSGVMKRWGFGGGRKTHGSRSHRIPGSIGQSATPGRVQKGKKMPGRMGFHQTTIKNLRIIDIRPWQNVIALQGAVPGSRNNIIEIKKA